MLREMDWWTFGGVDVSIASTWFGLRHARLKVVVLQRTVVSRFGCFVFEFWMLRFRVLSHRSFLSGHFCQLVFFDPVTPNELSEISNAFRPGKAAGHDRIPISIIKQSIQIIADPLAHIINLSISHGIVPDQMKIARVIPLFKAGDRSLFTNYRPISILPSFSKFLEKVVYNRLYNYLSKLEILCDNQFGFRKNHST